MNSTIPCHRGGHECRWPSCSFNCDGRPGHAALVQHDDHVWAWRMRDAAQWQHATMLSDFCKN